MHPQTLRQYDRLGLVRPQRTAGQSRRYSMRDVVQLREIAGLTAEGLNLEGIRRILELENLLQKIGDENSMLKLELEEKKAHLDYTNKVAMIESEKREQAETVIFGSDVYLRMQNSLNEGRMMDETDWQALSDLVNRVYSGFTEKLYELYNLSSQDYRVSLLIKVRVQPKDIAILTAHSKESVASTRSRLYSKVFGKKGSSKDWDEFILSI